MQFTQSCILFIVLLAVIGDAIAQECKLSIEKASLKASSTHLRIRGNIAVSNNKCKPTDNDSDDATTTVTFTTTKNIKFTDANNGHHAGNECTITAKWYNTPEKYNNSKKNTQVYVPFHTITNIKCNKDVSKPVTSTKKSSKPKTKKKTTTKNKTTTTSKKTTTTSKKTTTTTTAKKITTTTTKKAEPTASSSSSGGYTGTATFFTPNQGACGDWNTNSDLIAAIGGSLYGSYSKKSSYCGRKVQVTNIANGKSVTVTIKDACESCATTHIDLSPGAFQKIGDFDTGILKVNWNFL